MSKFLSTAKSLAFVCLLSLIASCGQHVDKTLTLENIDLSMEGPLYEGPNSANVTYKVDLSQISSTAEKVRGAKLTKISLSVPDSLNFDNFSDFKFQLTADDASMIEAAQLNPVPAGQSRIELTTSDEAELGDFFKLNEFIILIDGNAKEELYDNFNFKADLTFSIQVSE